MAKRSFDDNFWGDPFVQKIEKDAKLLFSYLWTNKRCNSAGLYEITPITIAFETGIDENEIPRLFEVLKEKVIWNKDDNIVWVKNFLKHQPQSPQFLKSVADCLFNTESNGIVEEYRSYYQLLGVSIPYRYPNNTIGKRYRYLSEPEPEPDIYGSSIIINDTDENLAKIAECYESNLGMISPAISEELKILSTEYPHLWFEEAVKEACLNNVRKLSYVISILKSWKVEGFKGSKKSKAKEKKIQWKDIDD